MEDRLENIEPKNNPYLVGHEEAEKMFLSAWKNNSLHQAWMISGPKGIGKATLAYRLARFLLYADETKKDSYTSLEIPSDSSVFKQILSGAHPDFKLLERGYLKTERQKIVKAIKDGTYLTDEQLGDLKKSSVITVDDVRTVNEFLSKKSADGRWRVVLIDSVDEMNSSSANAVLKILEEPPSKTLMLLVSHNPSRLLPTIRSRCAKLELKPLPDNLTASLLRRYRPELTEDLIKKTVAMAAGSIGKAISYTDGDAVRFYDKIYTLAAAGKKFKTVDMLKFCDEASSEDNYELFKELVLKFLSEQAKSLNKIEESADLFDKATKTFLETESLNMDKRQAVMTIMVGICKTY